MVMSNRRLGKFIDRTYRSRKIKDLIMRALLCLAAVIVLLPLLNIFSYVLREGLPALNADFFLQLPKPIGETGGGIAHALMGSAVLIGLASLLGVPWGIATGIYLSEFGSGKLAKVVRFSAELLASVPSIIIGLFVYSLVVLTMKRFSALAGGVALSILMVPTIARTTEELLRLIPMHIREAGLALGLPRWKVILFILLKGSSRGILTGVMLAISRAAGETAPLLFTAFGNQYWSTRLDQPIASLPVQIYTYAISPYEDWHRQAWAAAFILVCMVFSFNVLTRLVIRSVPRSSE